MVVTKLAEFKNWKNMKHQTAQFKTGDLALKIKIQK